MKTINKNVHKKQFSVAWGDMDALGHVNNGRYFDYFQQARIEWLESISFDMKQDEGPVVIHVACTFLKPIVYPAALSILSHVHTKGRSSFMMDHEIFQGEQLMAKGTSKIVWVNYKKQQSIALPEVIQNLFE